MVTAPAPSGQPYTKNPQVERKLRDAIIPNMLLADKLKWNWLFVVYAIYAYASDFLAAISGAGISFPLSKFAAGGAVQIDELFKGMPAWLIILTGASMVGWTVMKVVIKQNDGEKRANLMRNCRKDFRGFAQDCEVACQQTDPMPNLVILAQKIQATIQRHNAEDSWPYTGTFQGPKFEKEVEDRLKEYCNHYGGRWDPPPPQ